MTPIKGLFLYYLKNPECRDWYGAVASSRIIGETTYRLLRKTRVLSSASSMPEDMGFGSESFRSPLPGIGWGALIFQKGYCRGYICEFMRCHTVML